MLSMLVRSQELSDPSEEEIRELAVVRADEMFPNWYAMFWKPPHVPPLPLIASYTVFWIAHLVPVTEFWNPETVVSA